AAGRWSFVRHRPRSVARNNMRLYLTRPRAMADWSSNASLVVNRGRYAARVIVGTMFAIHVRAPKTKSLSARLAQYGPAFTESGLEFCAVDLPIREGPSDSDLADLRALSRELDTDVLWLGFSSPSDSFRFHHWRSGREVRAL